MATLHVDMEPWNDSGDFIMWQRSMKALLMRLRCLKAVEGEWPEGTSNDRKMDAEEIAFGEIWLHLTQSVQRPLSNITSAKELWEALNKTYMVSEEPDEVALMSKLYSFKMIQGQSVEANLDRLNKVVQ